MHKRVWNNILLFVIVFLICALFIEGVLWLFEPPVQEGIYELSNDTMLVYEHKRNSTYVVNSNDGTIEVRINEDGFRDEHVLEDLFSDTVVGVFGDSVTFGWDTDTTISMKLQEVDLRDVVYYNFAVGGYNTRQEVRLVEKYSPDYAVILLVLNDAEYLTATAQNVVKKVRGEETCLIVSLGVRVPCVVRDMIQSLRILRLVNKAWSNFNYEHKMSYVDTLWKDSLLKQKNVYEPLASMKAKERVIVFIVPMLAWEQGDDSSYPWAYIHEEISSFCVRENVTCVDLLPVLIPYDTKEFMVNDEDILHYNPEGQFVLATLMQPYIERVFFS